MRRQAAARNVTRPREVAGGAAVARDEGGFRWVFVLVLVATLLVRARGTTRSYEYGTRRHAVVIGRSTFIREVFC